jgi:hypothetical protein
LRREKRETINGEKRKNEETGIATEDSMAVRRGCLGELDDQRDETARSLEDHGCLGMSPTGSTEHERSMVRKSGQVHG